MRDPGCPPARPSLRSPFPNPTNWLSESSYNKVWKDVVSVVPDIKGMCVRDLRATAKTWMRKSGVRTPVAMAFLGHKPKDVHDMYDNVDASDLRAAAEVLRPEKLADVLAAYHDAQGVT